MGENISRAIKDRLLKRICQPKKEVTGSWRKLHRNKLYNVSWLTNIIRMSKSNTVQWT
jgi:hypothetical protein